MKFTKTRKVKSPTRGTSKAAGIDFYVPEDFETTILGPSEDVLIPSGLRVRIPEGFALIGFNKSGVATKKRFLVGACVIDEDYIGEMHLHLINAGKQSIPISAGDKIIQFILVPVNYAIPEELTGDEYESFGKTERNDGGFGSTDHV